MDIWRLIKTTRVADAFSGEGAFRYGGRWNSSGMRVIYASATLSLAALENLVHLSRPFNLSFRAFRISLNDLSIEVADQENLPAGWQAKAANYTTRTVGDQWFQSMRSAVLVVPSVIVRHENNYLLNPTHPDFQRLTIHPAEPFAFDPRLAR